AGGGGGGMAGVGVGLAAGLAKAGEFLADVQAYEVAGAEAIWLGPASLEPLTLLAAAAAATYRAGVGAWAPAEWPESLLARVVTTLAQLSRGRLVLTVGAGASIGAMRAAGAARVLVAGATEAVVAADGGVCGLA